MPSGSFPAMINKTTSTISFDAPWRNSNHKLYKLFDDSTELNLKIITNVCNIIFENNFIRQIEGKLQPKQYFNDIFEYVCT